jgi:hypothetical protein
MAKIVTVRMVRAQTKRRTRRARERGKCMGQIRSELLTRAISRLSELPVEEQDVTAIEILAQICSEQEWVLLAASEPYKKWQSAQPDTRPAAWSSLCERVL